MKWGKPDATDEEILQALRIAQADDCVLEKEGGLDFLVQQGGKNLSEQSETASHHRPCPGKEAEILIMDDSASALDFATGIPALRKAIRENTKDMTVFLVSQRATTIRQADRSWYWTMEKWQAVGLIASCWKGARFTGRFVCPSFQKRRWAKMRQHIVQL